jgi:tRNA U34 5-methylaminomethyl-2-thiouridine-forming methyltransferase MnmC
MNVLEVRLTGDGSHTVYNSLLDTTYHSTHGAVQESEWVFINNGLLAFDIFPKPVRLLEIGFGTGLNALLSWKETKRNPDLVIEYTGLEPFPLDPELSSAIEFQSATLNDDFQVLSRMSPGVKHGLSDRFTARISTEKFEQFEADEQFDLIYFDAFDPSTQPELWSEEQMKKCASLLAPGGIWISYSAKGDVRRSLSAAGLQVKRLTGPPFKRHILQAKKPG